MLPRLAGEAKSYAERLFRFTSIGALTDTAARLALEQPAAVEGVRYEKAALDKILSFSGQYPYFIQEYESHAWLTGIGDVIDAAAADRAHELVRSLLDTGFFNVRYERASRLERRYLSARASLGDGPQNSRAVATKRGYSRAAEAGTPRDSLIRKGWCTARAAPRSRTACAAKASLSSLSKLAGNILQQAGCVVEHLASGLVNFANCDVCIVMLNVASALLRAF